MDYACAKHIVSEVTRRLLRSGVMACAIVMLVTPITSTAQEAARAAILGTPAFRACIDTLSPRAFTPTIAYLDEMPSPDAPTPPPEMVARADSITRATATQLRLVIGGDTGRVAPGEPYLTWRSLSGAVALELERDGSMHAGRFSNPEANPDTSTLLLRTVRQVVAAMSPVRFANAAPASALFSIHFVAPTFDHAGTPQTVEAHAPSPVATVPQPWVEPPRVVKQGRGNYPDWVAQNGGSGRVWIRLEIGDDGRADMSTARTVWKGAGPEPSTGPEGRTYTALVQHTMELLRTSTFAPEQIGGCPTSAWLTYVETFAIEP